MVVSAQPSDIHFPWMWWELDLGCVAFSSVQRFSFCRFACNCIEGICTRSSPSCTNCISVLLLASRNVSHSSTAQSIHRIYWRIRQCVFACGCPNIVQRNLWRRHKMGTSFSNIAFQMNSRIWLEQVVVLSAVIRPCLVRRVPRELHDWCERDGNGSPFACRPVDTVDTV